MVYLHFFYFLLFLQIDHQNVILCILSLLHLSHKILILMLMYLARRQGINT